jgi:hypothetical protein
MCLASLLIDSGGVHVSDTPELSSTKPLTRTCDPPEDLEEDPGVDPGTDPKILPCLFVIAPQLEAGQSRSMQQVGQNFPTDEHLVPDPSALRWMVEGPCAKLVLLVLGILRFLVGLGVVDASSLWGVLTARNEPLLGKREGMLVTAHSDKGCS